MIRNVLGSLLALAGAVTAALSPFRVWYAGRHGSGYRVDDLFRSVGVTTRDAALLGSLFLPMGFAALLTLLGVLLRSRVVVALAGMLVLGVTVLWMVRQAQFSHVLAMGGDGLGRGVGDALLGAVLLLAGSALVAQPRPRPADEPSPEQPSPEQPSLEQLPAAQPSGDVGPEQPSPEHLSADPPPASPASPSNTAPEPPGPPPYPPQMPEAPEPDGTSGAPTLVEMPELPRLPELRPLPVLAEPVEPPDVPSRQPLTEDSPPGM